MAKIKDFAIKYALKILVIDPAFASGCGWSILNQESEVFGGVNKKPLIHRSGVIMPFSSDSTLENMSDLVKKLKEICQADMGFSSQPSVVVIECPVNYPGSPVRFRSIEDLNILVGMIIATFNPTKIIAPTPSEWKGNKSKDITKSEILAICDQQSLKNIERDMQGIAIDKRHNAYDAMAIGVYALKVLNNEIQLPRLHLYFY